MVLIGDEDKLGRDLAPSTYEEGSGEDGEDGGDAQRKSGISVYAVLRLVARVPRSLHCLWRGRLT